VTSDQSEIARRIETLTQQLRQCKAEADALRKEQRRQHKMKLKAKEESLRRQIEVNTGVISTLLSEAGAAQQLKHWAFTQ